MAELLGIGISALAVILIRLIVPFSIFRWPLWGGLAAAIADTLDVVIITVLDPNNTANFYLQHYTELDKALDIYFLLFMMIVSLRWKEKLAKWTSISLFTYRAIGVVVLELTHIRQLLFVFPNLFIWWFFFWEARNKFKPEFKLTPKLLIIILLVMLPFKLGHEYFLHVYQAHPWEWIKANIIGKIF